MSQARIPFRIFRLICRSTEAKCPVNVEADGYISMHLRP